ncbi:MAG: MarR family transcriptional regulator [Burkholderiales bacterium]|nr:MarR family transcriptional regulator [Burkholderiales bacterium]
MVTAPRRGSDTLDTETRTSDEDHLALRLWLRLLACTNRVEAPLRQRLREQFEGSLPRFDLMAQLERHPGGLRMNELSARLMVTGGNVTGLTDRLVAEGLVDKRTPSTDRRACTVALTPAGRRQFAAMARAHESWLVELLGGLSTAQQKQLYELLGQLKTALPAK